MLMRRPLRILLFGFLLLAVLLPPVPGETGRNGGIVILPSAHALGDELLPQGHFIFALGTPVLLRVPPELEKAAVFVEVAGENISSNISFVRERTIVLEPEELEQLRNTGVEAFTIKIVNEELQGLVIEVEFDSSGKNFELTIF
jgi:hypothetical protein